ncbi:glutamate 5-kinase [Paraferrimonas haliotis]|uniref:Glutamate 5-kinase n=1 Tax=Paraferrimonas haliotis TaxID=2013866 RepID=A0AA37TLM1_9GAMM|nr:glutamate 5-kinase [Paraferrimonas haliotis]GLS83887.1 glutamate 5-kinase [Paraferrimonas haliotis]GLS84014.1 glutamate 5-kinase [Paraferrimonas haliotis]
MQKVRQHYQRVVVKLGTSVLTGNSDRLNRNVMQQLAQQMAQLRNQGIDVILCTSGAIAAGREHLNFPILSETMADKQLLAAVGQSQLIQGWQSLFQEHHLQVGQLLLTGADLRNRKRYLNAKDTLSALLEHGIIPIINENDAVATAEIKVGDNDNLSARVALLAQADCLLLLTDQAGLFDADPRLNSNAQLIQEVPYINEEIVGLAGGSSSHLGTGGMLTKLQAATIAQRAGIDVVIAAGAEPNVIVGLANHERIGTRFPAQSSPLERRKQWLLAGPKVSGALVIDAGAEQALTQTGRSLLAKGIVERQGLFQRGDMVQLLNETGSVIGRGLCRYDHDEVEKIKGLHSANITQVLGYDYGKVVVHRNDMVLEA